MSIGLPPVDTLLASSSSLHVGTSHTTTRLLTRPHQGTPISLDALPHLGYLLSWTIPSSRHHPLPLHIVYPSCSTSRCNSHFHLHKETPFGDHNIPSLLKHTMHYFITAGTPNSEATGEISILLMCCSYRRLCVVKKEKDNSGTGYNEG